MSLLQNNIEFKRYTYTLPNAKIVRYVVIAFIVLLTLLIGIVIHNSGISAELFYVMAGVTLVFITAIIIIQNSYATDQAIDLYENKLVLVSDNEKTINFSDIREYRRTFDNQTYFLFITLNNGEKINLWGNMGQGEFGAFLEAFDNTMKYLINEKMYSIIRKADFE